MARVQDVTMLIYEDDKKLIEAQTLNHRNIETGGDLFGLWQSESEVVVQVVTGPGRNCRRTTTSFFQDKTYLSDVGNYLTSSKGLCNIGEWHSHHSLNLPEPSGGDRATVWRNMPGYGLERFLLIIATIKREGNPEAEMNGFMFTSPEHGHRQGQMIHVRPRILSGPNPFLNQPEVVAKLRDGAEPSPRAEIMAASEEGRRVTNEEKKKQKKADKSDKKITKKAEKEKLRQQKEAEKQGKNKNGIKYNKRPRFKLKFSRPKGKSNYNPIPDNGLSKDPQSGSFIAQSSNNVNDYPGDHITSNQVSSNLRLLPPASPSSFSQPRQTYL